MLNRLPHALVAAFALFLGVAFAQGSLSIATGGTGGTY